MDSFLNHQVYPAITERMAAEMEARFRDQRISNVTRVLTAEVSGIPVALQVAKQFGAQLIYEQSAAMPRRSPFRSSACNSVTIIRAPEAPTGWPNAQAPP